jgi:hypothetical protein
MNLKYFYKCELSLRLEMNMFYFYLFTDSESFDNTLISKPEPIKAAEQRRSTFLVEPEGRHSLNFRM